MTNFAPISLCEILPSGEAFERVRPGISRVVGRLRAQDDERDDFDNGSLAHDVRR